MKSMKKCVQFSIRQMLGWMLLASVLMAGVYWWHWWNYTRHIRELCHAVSASALDPESKLIINRLAWTRSAWDSGLIGNLAGPTSMKQIVWKGRTRCRQQGNCDIYIFDAFIRPVAGDPIPPVCVLLDRHMNIVAWETVAPYSSGFLSATIDERDVLVITTVANWFYGKGVYRYAVRSNSIAPLGEGDFSKFKNEERPSEMIPDLMSPDPALQGVLERIRRRSS